MLTSKPQAGLTGMRSIEIRAVIAAAKKRNKLNALDVAVKTGGGENK